MILYKLNTPYVSLAQSDSKSERESKDLDGRFTVGSTCSFLDT